MPLRYDEIQEVIEIARKIVMEEIEKAKPKKQTPVDDKPVKKVKEVNKDETV